MADGETPQSPSQIPAPLSDGVKPSHLGPKFLYSDIVQGQVVQSISSGPQSIDLTTKDPHQISESTSLKEFTLYQGKPTVVIPISEKHALVEKLQYVLVGKFSHGRPPMDTIKKFFLGLKLKGSCNSASYDYKHIFIECAWKDDFYRLWLELKWIIAGYVMRVFKWSPDFSPATESPIAPVWIRVEGLPLYLFDKMSLMSISSSIGKPIIVDQRSVNRTMLNSARICVELDVSKPLLDAILINFIDEPSNVVLEQFWVKVFYDVVPLLCAFCCHIGHGMGVCKRKWEEDRSGKVSVREKANFIHADQLFDEMSQSGNSAPSTQLAAEENRSMIGRMSKVWQPVLGARAASGASVLDAKEMKRDRCVGLTVDTIAPDFDKTTAASTTAAIQVDKDEQLRTQQETLIVQNSPHPSNLQQINDVEGPAQGISQHINGVGYVNTEKLRLQREKGPGQPMTEDCSSIEIEPVKDIIAPDLEPVQYAKEPKVGREISASTNFCFAGACEQVAAIEPAMRVSDDIYSESGGNSLEIEVNVAGQSIAQTGDFLAQPCDLHDIATASECHDSPLLAQNHAHSVVHLSVAVESSVPGQNLGKESHAAKVFDKMTESSSVSDLVPPLGDAFDMADLHGGAGVIEGGVNTIETSGIQTNKYEFHTPNRPWVEVPSLGISEDNGIIKGKYRGSDLIACQQKVNSFIKDVADLREKIDKADSAILDQIGKSPATKVFLKSHFERCILFPLPMTDLIDNEDKPDPCTKFDLPEGGQTTNMVSEDQTSHVTILPKLCYEQVSKTQGAQKWRKTVQIAPISEGPGIVKAALLQLGGKECVTEMRGGFPFDDKG
ncbi:hypothetical protein LIER_05724 [Lithospermum erythrorhizon]|uniref:DUF4283 domain-containing protein n=1 Tax=Lithospermum erythrorhizon TaxID=34254 RepID=A0AAV3P2V8_LITER